MIDHLVGRPSPSWKRVQVLLVLMFWIWRIFYGNPGGPRILWLRRLNRALGRFTPWQIVVSTLCGVYATRHLDKMLGLSAPEPLANLYSPSYYRATWIATALDAGFATAMSIRRKWIRDICSMLFTVYYIIYASEADEKLRKFRAVPTVEMLRTTWEKTTNPYLRAYTNLHLPKLSVRRRILLPRPTSSSYDSPIAAYLYFAPPEHLLSQSADLILDYPGGGFVAMTPEHHEERLRAWARITRKPVLSIEYGKAPEYPYPYAMDEAFDVYRILVESKGTAIGMSGKRFNTVLAGDSAGASLAVGVMIKVLEYNNSLVGQANHVALPKPLALVLNYAALDFNFTSWMTPQNLRVLRSEQSSGNLPGLKELAKQKDHLGHISPLSMVGDKRSHKHRSGSKGLKRRRSWRDTLMAFGGDKESSDEKRPRQLKYRHSVMGVGDVTKAANGVSKHHKRAHTHGGEDPGVFADEESEDDEDMTGWKEEDRPIQARVRYTPHDTIIPATPASARLSASTAERAPVPAVIEPSQSNAEGERRNKGKEPIGTRLTMTSRTGYFQDRIISPSMMRAMAILYIGPHRNPDFSTDYYLSPILSPSHLLAQFPPLLMQCGEKDPFVDDTVIFAGRVREAKRARRAELESAISGMSAQFGESLRMSAAHPSSVDAETLAAMKTERHRLKTEREEDWVEVVLFSDWSHGYLQMVGLMSEAAAAIEELGAWINTTFEKQSPGERKGEAASMSSRNAETREKHKNVKMEGSKHSSQAPDRLKSPHGASAGSMAPVTPFTSETETDDSMITFVPRRNPRSRPGSMDSARVDVGSPSRTSTPRGRVSDSSGSDKTLQDEEEERQARARTLSVDKKDGKPGLDRMLSSDLTDPAGLRGPGDQEEAEDRKVGWGGPVRTGTPTKTGRTITESELMRRRRLLDAHIFE